MWLALVTGARRGELCAQRWSHIDLDAGVVAIRRNYVAGREKVPKTHQIRRVSIDSATVELIERHWTDCANELAPVGVSLDRTSFIFSATPDRSRPRNPSAMSHRFKRLVDDLGVDTHLHALRHYAATELLAAGIDLRTVAGRLGHGDGTTTLRHYAAWVSSADLRAADILSTGLSAFTDPAGESELNGRDSDSNRPSVRD